MSMRPQLWSISGAAVELNMDRRTVASALAHIPPDGQTGPHSVWFMATIVKALKVGASESYGLKGRPLAVVSALVDNVERLGQALAQGLDRLRSEPDIGKRRELLREIGPLVGQFDQAIARCNSMTPDGERELLSSYCGTMVGRAIGEILALCEWEVAGTKACRMTDTTAQESPPDL